jgi:hypothetical protein
VQTVCNNLSVNEITKNGVIQKVFYIVIGFVELAKLGSERSEGFNIIDNKILRFVQDGKMS